MPTVTTSQPTTLFHIAAQQYGDPLCWWQIAQLNNLSDPQLPGGVSVALPGVVAADNDGVEPQS